MFVAPQHPAPPAIVQGCDYQIEVTINAQRAYKCITEQEKVALDQEDEKRQEAFAGFMNKWWWWVLPVSVVACAVVIGLTA